MAGEWIKMEKATPDKPEVIAIASRLGIDPDAAFGKLFRVWCWFDSHTIDGNAVGVTFSFLDRIAGVTGFAEQMALAGWLIENGSTLSLPNFEYHNGESAKKRAVTQKRVANHRDRVKRDSNADVTHGALPKALPEKRREDIKEAAPNNGAHFVDPKKIIFDVGVDLLKACGSSDVVARTFLGMYAKTDDVKLAEVIGHLAANPKIEPKSYIVAAMKPKVRAVVL